jgi:hypothetical protein
VTFSTAVENACGNDRAGPLPTRSVHSGRPELNIQRRAAALADPGCGALRRSGEDARRYCGLPSAARHRRGRARSRSTSSRFWRGEEPGPSRAGRRRTGCGPQQAPAPAARGRAWRNVEIRESADVPPSGFLPFRAPPGADGATSITKRSRARGQARIEHYVQVIHGPIATP